MKILFLSEDFPPQSFGGAGISTYDLACGIKKAGHEVFVITTCRKKEDAGEFTYQGLKIFRIASSYHERWRAYLGLCNPGTVRRVEEVIKKINPDIVHANNIHFHLSYHTLKIAKRYAKGVVLTFRDVMAFSYGKLDSKKYLEHLDAHLNWSEQLIQAKKRWNPFRNAIIKWYLKYADILFAVSDALTRALAQNGIRNVNVIHTGVNLNFWQGDDKDAVRFREKYGLKNKKVVLFSGRLSESKGGGKSVEAMAHIIKRVPNAVLLVAGKEDGYGHAMKEKAKELGIGEEIIFTGWLDRDEMRGVYFASDVVLVPSLCFDAFPRTVLEAMASKKPVVATKYGGAPEAVLDGVTGFIIDPRSVGDITEKIVELLTDEVKAKQFGEAGYERVKKDFNLSEKVDLTMREYQKLLDENA